MDVASDARASRSPDPGRDWVALPWSRSPRWYVPRHTGPGSQASLFVYHPVTLRSRAGWEVARMLAARGVFRLARGSSLLPREVWEAAAPLLPPGGALAIARANHAGRFLSLVADADGRLVAFVKIARDRPGAEALTSEREALERWGGLVPPPLHAPRVVSHSDGVLVLEPVHWRPRLAPWVMPPHVAYALGKFFRATVSDGGVGVAHGDCAPWNLLHDPTGWALIDWENAMEGMPPFYDLFHFLVQTTIELRRPTRRSIVEALDLRGPIGRTVEAYADGSGVDPRQSKAMFLDYLGRSAGKVEPGAPDRALRIRRQLTGMVLA